MKNSLQSKVIVITGASSGFGKGAALELARSGATLVLAARRKGALKEVEMGCIASGSEALVVQTDVSKAEDIENLAGAAIEKYGRIDAWCSRRIFYRCAAGRPYPGDRDGSDGHHIW
ncbi:MAG: SDR family NAD(P)-dependent oxidoreductase [Cyanobacteria bacterium SZAS LIN-3]|nr:SDR family NAD(P)-dependent oxidoreductase [Cyanobacteria bacterium SZAS LIN-3]MBS2008991.1 SDR family NAD(P)-dependent oxidoreductase [Cyanobacteria bacterium SZAS TMP-1]